MTTTVYPCCEHCDEPQAAAIHAVPCLDCQEVATD